MKCNLAFSQTVSSKQKKRRRKTPKQQKIVLYSIEWLCDDWEHWQRNDEGWKSNRNRNRKVCIRVCVCGRIKTHTWVYSATDNSSPCLLFHKWIQLFFPLVHLLEQSNILNNTQTHTHAHTDTPCRSHLMCIGKGTLNKTDTQHHRITYRLQCVVRTHKYTLFFYFIESGLQQQLHVDAETQTHIVDIMPMLTRTVSGS